jgi:hypothetical protein
MAPDPIADDDQSIGDDVVRWCGITPEQIKPDGAGSDGAFRAKECRCSSPWKRIGRPSSRS